MPRRVDAKTLSNVQLTPAQYDAVQTAASAAGKNVAEFVRDVLRQTIRNFPAETFQPGNYDRRRAYVAWCIQDDDVVRVEVSGVPVDAWQERWHREIGGKEVPTVYKLLVGEEEPKDFASLSELLDAMVALAPFDQWRVAGE